MGHRSVNFSGAIKGLLEINFKDKPYKVHGGDIKHIDITLYPWGLEGSLSFLVMCNQEPDGLLESFTADDPFSINLQLDTELPAPGVSKTAPWKLKAMVASRTYSEETNVIASSLANPIYMRRYTLTFVDAAKFYWSQHYPLELFADSDLKTIIEAQIPEGLNISLDWDEVLGKKFPQILISTGFQGAGCSSFYDFIWWVTFENQGYFLYNHLEDSYTLKGKRDDKGDATPLPRILVSEYTVKLPSLDYSTPIYTNGSAKDASTQQGANQLGVSPLKREFLTITATPAQFDSYVSTQKKNFKQPKGELSWSYSALPDAWPLPGDAIKFNTDTWSQDAYPADKTFRVNEIRLIAMTPDAVEERPTYLEESGIFMIDMGVLSEPIESDAPLFSDYKIPYYPIQIEGYIFSDKGDDDAETYAFAEDENTKLRYYQAEIPSWESSKVRVPYEPQQVNGQFYFPPYKKQRVLLSLEFTTSRIERYLDWRTYSTLPMDGQGNHIVMGQSEKSLTSIKHAYADNKPQLDIMRTMDKDSETISIGEGYIRLHTKEDK